MTTPDLKKNGDVIERGYYEFINSRLPFYEQIWCSYIGNKGNNTPCDLSGLSREGEEENRLTFSQYLYTCLLSILLMKQCNEKLNCFTVQSEEIDRHLEVMNWFTSFMSHVGKTRDIMIKMGNHWNLPKLADNLNEYYQRRNIVIHEAALPYFIDDELIKIMIPKGVEADSSKWSGKGFWNSVKQDDLKYMQDYVEETFNEIVTLVNNDLATLNSNKILVFLGERRCYIDSSAVITTDSSANVTIVIQS